MKGLNPDKELAVGKENIPSTSQQVVIDEKKEKEEEVVLTYMKTMYQTHGENLLNKFRSDESIRTSLRQVDNADRLRAETLKKNSFVNGKKADNSNISESGALSKDSVKYLKQETMLLRMSLRE